MLNPVRFLSTLALDNDYIITDLEFDCDDKLSVVESVEMKLRKVLHFDEHNSSKKVGYLKSVLESRAEDLLLEGVEEILMQLYLMMLSLETQNHKSMLVRIKMMTYLQFSQRNLFSLFH